MTVNDIPTSFTLGGRLWTVKFVEKLKDGYTYAIWNDTDATITIATTIVEDKQPVSCTEYQMVNSFWHEIGHVFQYYSQGNTDDTFAQTFATFITEFMNSKTKQE